MRAAVQARALTVWPLLALAGLALGLRAETIPEELGLNQAIEIALSNHDDLEAARAAIAARAGSTLQAGTSPNPVFTLQTENWRFHGDPAFSLGRSLDVFAFVTVPVETAGKRMRRVELAANDERIAEHERQLISWRIRQQVKAAYWKALAAESDAAMLSRRRETLQRVEGYHAVQVRQGAAAEVNLIRARIDTGRAAVALAGAEMEASRAKIALVAAMGVSQTSTDFALLRPAPRSAIPGWDQGVAMEASVASALAHRAELLLARALVERAQAALSLERARARPDLRPYVGYKRTNSLDTVIGGLMVDLPVRDKNTGNIEEAVAEVRQQEAVLRASEARVRSEVISAVETVRRRAETLRTMESGVLDGARETFRIARAAVNEGGAEPLDVLAAQSVQDEVELIRSRLQFDYETSWVELETAMGTPEQASASHAARPIVAGFGVAAE
ncbi:MAG: TolC family protein [Bryobacterales bacterium]|nr:TolC family protein [Bryobacterales bacterium]